MQKRLKNDFHGEAEFCADKAISTLISDTEPSNSEKPRLMLKILRKVISEELTERQRQMITLYYFDKANIPQIAEMLGVNRSTVSRTISRGRRNIMEKMKHFI